MPGTFKCRLPSFLDEFFLASGVVTGASGRRLQIDVFILLRPASVFTHGIREPRPPCTGIDSLLFNAHVPNSRGCLLKSTVEFYLQFDGLTNVSRPVIQPILRPLFLVFRHAALKYVVSGSRPA